MARSLGLFDSMTSTNGVPLGFLRLLSILIFLCGSPAFAEGKLTPEKVAKIRKAAEGGDAQAQHYLGKCLTYEMGVKKDLPEAFKWFQKSADQGYVSAQYRVGKCYQAGTGVPKNDEQAILWLELAAHGGDTEAMEILGYIYAVRSTAQKKESEYTPEGYISKPWIYSQREAYMWFNLAAAAGSTHAVKNLKKLAGNMSTDDIAVAQNWSSRWKPDPAALQEKRTKRKNGGLRWK